MSLFYKPFVHPNHKGSSVPGIFSSNRKLSGIVQYHTRIIGHVLVLSRFSFVPRLFPRNPPLFVVLLHLLPQVLGLSRRLQLHHLPLVVMVHRLLNRADGIAQAAVLPPAVPGTDRRRLRSAGKSFSCISSYPEDGEIPRTSATVFALRNSGCSS